jgi:hypothetical protein
MKRCPKCRRRYIDHSVNFCLDDGSPLLTEPDSDPTLVSPTLAAPGIPYWTGTRANPPQAPKSPNRWILPTVIILFAGMVGGGAVAFLYRINRWDSSNASNTAKASPTSPAKLLPTLEQDQSNLPNSDLAPLRTPSISGEWHIVNTIERTSYPRYANLQVGFHIIITQRGNKFTAEGEKDTENGREMDAAERTPIHITGSIEQDVVRATFVEEGLRRMTSGSFTWTIAAGAGQLRGTFVSSAAWSSGPSMATREK